jgi:hypothetical protein
VVIRVAHGALSDNAAAARALRLQALQRRVAEMGWRLSSDAATMEIIVPAAAGESGAS